MNARAFAAAAMLFTATVTPVSGSAAERADESLVGTAANLELHSQFWLNLHHVLYAAAWDRRPEQGPARAAGRSVGFATPLTQDEQRAWDAAVDVYARDVASKDLLFDYALMGVKIALGEADDRLPDTRALPAALKEALESAAPIYRAHAWAADDRANRAWIDEARRHLEQLAPEVTPRLAARFGPCGPRRRCASTRCASASVRARTPPSGLRIGSWSPPATRTTRAGRRRRSCFTGVADVPARGRIDAARVRGGENHARRNGARARACARGRRAPPQRR